jgi:hypothetical protein
MAVAEQSSVLRGVVPGFSKEAKARASPSPSLGGFGCIDSPYQQSIHQPSAAKIYVVLRILE